jgi:hypothetical protein
MKTPNRAVRRHAPFTRKPHNVGYDQKIRRVTQGIDHLDFLAQSSVERIGNGLVTQLRPRVSLGYQLTTPCTASGQIQRRETILP